MEQLETEPKEPESHQNSAISDDGSASVDRCQASRRPCHLCLPLHRSCDKTSCPSLLAWYEGLESDETSSALNDDADPSGWAITTTLELLKEAASNGCEVCATIYTGIMTIPSYNTNKNPSTTVHSRVRIGGHGQVVVISSEPPCCPGFNFSAVHDSGKSSSMDRDWHEPGVYPVPRLTWNAT